jgi:hypothetical protein
LDDWIEIKSTAYHEAGHVVSAVVQGLPLCDGGMRIDLRGSGVSHYRLWEPDGDSSSPEDEVGRRKSIISLHSGKVAQTRFLPDYDDPVSWEKDDLMIAELIRGITSETSDNIRSQTYHTAECLIEKHWSLVVGLAMLLWNRPKTQMPDEEFAKGWSKSPHRRERFLSTAEVRNYLVAKSFHCEVR